MRYDAAARLVGMTGLIMVLLVPVGSATEPPSELSELATELARLRGEVEDLSADIEQQRSQTSLLLVQMHRYK